MYFLPKRSSSIILQRNYYIDLLMSYDKGKVIKLFLCNFLMIINTKAVFDNLVGNRRRVKYFSDEVFTSLLYSEEKYSTSHIGLPPTPSKKKEEKKNPGQI